MNSASMGSGLSALSTCLSCESSVCISPKGSPEIFVSHRKLARFEKPGIVCQSSSRVRRAVGVE